MKLQFVLFPLLAGALALTSSPAPAQADVAPVAAKNKAGADRTSPERVGWSHDAPDAEPALEGSWLDGVEALQKDPAYTGREARRVKRDALRAVRLDRRATRQAYKQARADEKPRRIKN